MSLDWKCECGERAWYHDAGDGKHRYFCKKHWSEHLTENRTPLDKLLEKPEKAIFFGRDAWE